MVSLRMCVISWILEIFGTLCQVLFILINSHFGNSGIHYIEAITMFIIIPFVHLMNDDDTKGKIADYGWFAGLMNMFGMRSTERN